MKKALIITALAILASCSPLKDVDTSGLTHQGQDIYYNGQLAARLSSVELAYDSGKIVREVTFTLVDAKYNELALPIIAFMRDHDNSIEVEVELRRQ